MIYYKNDFDLWIKITFVRHTQQWIIFKVDKPKTAHSGLGRNNLQDLCMHACMFDYKAGLPSQACMHSQLIDKS